MPTPLELKVNGVSRSLDVDSRRPLLGVLRDELALTGTKYGCGEGECGACTVLIDGRAVRSCRTAVESAVGKEITTIEGLEKDGKLHPVQEGFLAAGAMQCGYCVPGMILSTVALLGRNPNPGDDEVRRALQGNICRCGVYSRILEAVRIAAKAGKERQP